MKKLSAIVLALLVVITAFPAAAFAHSDDESVCDSGSCWTISFDTQSMGMEQLKNARGLGNYVVEDGRHIKSRTLFRSGALCDASESDLDDLQHEYHISCIIDLRPLSEAEAHPDPAVKGARIISCPVNRVRLATDPENQKSFAKVFQALLQADGRPALSPPSYCRRSAPERTPSSRITESVMSTLEARSSVSPASRRCSVLLTSATAVWTPISPIRSV